MKVACYLRRGSRQSRREHDEIRDWLATTGVPQEEVEWFADEAAEDASARPAFERLQAAIARGEVRAIVLWKVDRLGLRLQDSITTLADWCARGLKIVVVALRLELSGEAGRPLAALLLDLAEMERTYRRSRQATGIAEAKKRGVYKGRARGTTKADPNRVRQLRDKGLSVAEIAQATGVSERTITRYLGQDGEAGSVPAE